MTLELDGTVYTVAGPVGVETVYIVAGELFGHDVYVTVFGTVGGVVGGGGYTWVTVVHAGVGQVLHVGTGV